MKLNCCTIYSILITFLFSTTLIAQNEDEKYLSKQKRSVYYYFDEDMEIVQLSNNFEPQEINKLHKYAKGDWMFFSEKNFRLSSSLDYTYVVSEDFIKDIDTIKPLTELFKEIYDYNDYVVHGSYAIITKGKLGRYNVYVDGALSCMANLVGLTYEEQNKHNINRRFKIKYPRVTVENKLFKECNIRPISDLEDWKKKPSQNTYYKDINTVYNNFLGHYDYVDSIQRLDVKIVKRVKKVYLKSDNRKSYFVDNLELTIKHWYNGKVIFDSMNTDITSIVNVDYSKNYIDFVVNIKRKDPANILPLLKFTLHRKANNLGFNASYSYRKNTYSSTSKKDVYNFPQYITIKKYSDFNNKVYLDDIHNKDSKVKPFTNKSAVAELDKLLKGNWKLRSGKGPQKLEFFNTYKRKVVVSNETEKSEDSFQLYYHYGFKMRIYSKAIKTQNSFEVSLEDNILSMKNIDTQEHIVYKRSK